MKIKNIKAREIFDSRGNPTVEVEIETSKGKFLGAVASGASVGKNEAVELRDADGKGVKKAITNVKKLISPALKGKEFSSQVEIDDILIKIDGTENKARLGVNAILPTSIAVCRALAAEGKVSLFRYIAEIHGNKNIVKIPLPCFNILEGGAHAKNDLDIQEFMIVPQKTSFVENFKIASDIYQSLRSILVSNFGENSVGQGDEGGFSAPIDSTEKALLILVNSLGAHQDVKFGLDIAASQFYKKERYNLDGRELTRNELVDYYKEIISRFPVTFIEDPFEEEDWVGFEVLTKETIGKVNILGDDLTTTNIKRIKEAENKKACNGVIIKPNQIGTVSEAIDAAKLAQSFGWKVLVSHRSGETHDDFIADLAVGVQADFFKAGAPVTPERMVKYNRMLEIESELRNTK